MKTLSNKAQECARLNKDYSLIECAEVVEGKVVQYAVVLNDGSDCSVHLFSPNMDKIYSTNFY